MVKSEASNYYKEFKETISALRYMINSTISRSKGLREILSKSLDSEYPEFYVPSSVEKFLVAANEACLVRVFLKSEMEAIDNILAREKTSKDFWVEYSSVVEILLAKRAMLAALVLENVRGRTNRNSTSAMENLSNACKDEAAASFALDLDSIIKSLKTQREERFPEEKEE